MATRTITPSSDVLAWAAITVKGNQSEQFLQGQLSQDLSDLDSSGAWSLLLAPDGTVISSCFVEGHGDHFVLTFPRDVGEVALARLRRFHLRVDCTLELADASVGPFERAQQMIEAGWPASAEFEVPLTPQTFGAAFVDATVSFTKGCFTGQELVGRLDARGSSVPWRLVRCSGPSVERVDEVLRSKGPDGPRGVTTAVATPHGVVALGIAHRTLLDATVLAEIQDVTVEAVR